MAKEVNITFVAVLLVMSVLTVIFFYKWVAIITAILMVAYFCITIYDCFTSDSGRMRGGM